jgi:hypothetical protein
MSELHGRRTADAVNYLQMSNQQGMTNSCPRHFSSLITALGLLPLSGRDLGNPQRIFTWNSSNSNTERNLWKKEFLWKR